MAAEKKLVFTGAYCKTHSWLIMDKLTIKNLATVTKRHEIRNRKVFTNLLETTVQRKANDRQ